MKNRSIATALSCFLYFQMMPPGFAEQIAAAPPQEATANTMAFPSQILKAGVNLTSDDIAPNSAQLADTIGLTPLLRKIRALKEQVAAGNSGSLENLAARQELWETIQKADILIQRTNLEIDFTTAEIQAETQLYQEILTTFTNDRDKVLARTNAASFISNGVLWAACEGISIATVNTVFAKNPRTVPQFTIPAGILGVVAGVVPSVASMYTLKAVNGKKKTSEVEPNMLAKIFNYPTTADIEYPSSVWKFLQQVPAAEPNGKDRTSQLVDRWIADSNMPAFTDRHSKTQLDVLTASKPTKKGLSIATLSARIVMLQTLQSEIFKMKRLLLELTLVLQGEKQISG